MRIYRHRQTATVILMAMTFAVILVGAAMVKSSETDRESLIALTIALLWLIVCMVLFGSLTVEVSEEWIRLWFGPGLVRKRFRVEEVRRAEAVRNRWYYGWGIRRAPGAWLFNASGLDAVEIEMDSGKRYRIGTDEPQRLLSAIRQVIRAD